MSDISPPARKVSDLQRELAAQIMDTAEKRGLDSGDPLRESVFAKELSVSRTPVRAALDFLCEIGVAEHRPRRGYFLCIDADKLPNLDFQTTGQQAYKLYHKIIDAYFAGDLCDRISEAELMRRFQTERAPLQEALFRLSNEGLVRQNPGYGWQVTPLAKSREAEAEDMFRFRLLLEPAVFLEPGYTVDSERIAELRLEQTHLIDTIMTDFDLTLVYESNIRLHGTLISFCRNRFFIRALDSDEPAGRIKEYQNYQNKVRTLQACHEHVAILDAVDAGDLDRASDLMRAHILSAKEASK
ncbi:GntR family transcriptional regulator [Ruegeria arenilitoris]|uniref:GntR family transcriptional regulator n=1 Tax=Ruegeria arenilitoris TaxID=1173585 RepID=UPI00147CF3C4|nr:GntR family transcriptional regulator [Ruegeria arenilitoris]